MLLCAAFSTPTGTAETTETAEPAPEAVSVNVVAHQDDDILFLNPDVQNSIRSGRQVKTVFITAGEAGYAPEAGKNETPDARACRERAQLDRERYARCRQLGARAAYARMASVADEWTQQEVPLAGSWVEIHTLVARPAIQLVFLNLPDWADTQTDVSGGDERLKGASLHHLWANERTTRTIVPVGSAISPAHRGTYQDGRQVVSVLAAMYQRFRATVIRIQDPEPDSRYRFNPSWGHDHSDHIAGARLAEEAARIYAGPDGRPIARVVPYRNYNINDAQANLDAGHRGEKATVFAEYVRFDAEIGTPPTGDYAGWPERVYYRWSTGTTWTGRNQDGTLQAFAVQGNKLVTWRQRATGEFAPPVVLTPPGPLAPGLSVTANADGRLEVLARRLDTHEIITTWQATPNGDIGRVWASLGNPNTAAGAPAQVGSPVAARLADGTIRVFAKNGGGGLSTKAQTAPNAGYGPWTDLGGGPGVQDGLTVGVTPDGGTAVFAYAVEAGIGQIKHWAATPGTQAFTSRPNLTGSEPAGPPRAAVSRNGSLTVCHRLARNAQGDNAGLVGCHRQLPGGSWSTTSQNVGGHGGVDGLAAVDAVQGTAADSRILLFATNRGGGLSTTRQVAPDGLFGGQWSDLGGVLVGQPSAAKAADGTVFVFALTDSGGLLVRNQIRPGGDQDLLGERVLDAP
ncbi:PIG-L family deacetylase [Amycolatopsis magusensis]|uniref:PIG-L family deacetylase n=1 Tax=Amycolatopsis magusensis TaxID=882444 RepID=UPI0024A9C0F1|nr:PIG-L family deacetylase [Amycolatopsis magusensis]